MPTTYEKAGKDVHDLVSEVMKKYHTELPQNGVNVGVIFARNSEGPAVKKGGYPCAGKISIVSLKDRCEKEYEAELIIDLGWWTEGTTKHHRALIDHELSHLELVEDEEEGGYKTDDQGRPCLKIRLGDWNVGDGFQSVVERHGDYAVEIASLRKAEAKVCEVKSRLFTIDTPPKEETAEPVEVRGRDGTTASVTITANDAKKMAAALKKQVKKKQGPVAVSAANPTLGNFRDTLIADLEGIGPKTAQILGQLELTTVGKVLDRLEKYTREMPEKAPKTYLQSSLAGYCGILPADAKKVIDVVYDFEAKHIQGAA